MALVAAGAQAVDPPRLLRGVLPRADPRMVGAALALLDMRVNGEGSVTDVRALGPAEPFARELRRAARQFRFRPARQAGEPVAAHTLVAGYLRAPSLHVVGPVEVPPAAPRSAVAWPTAVTPPAYPPTARGDATVIVDLRLDPQGVPFSAAVIESAPGFDEAAVAAAREWRFALPGTASASVVLVLVFREPADLGPSPR